jgi:hypothetical protein
MQGRTLQWRRELDLIRKNRAIGKTGNEAYCESAFHGEIPLNIAPRIVALISGEPDGWMFGACANVAHASTVATNRSASPERPPEKF